MLAGRVGSGMRLGLVVAGALLWAGSPACADGPSNGTPAAPATAGAPAAAAQPPDPSPPPDGKTLSEMIGLKPTLDDLRLNVYGWLEQSVTANPDDPGDDLNVLRIFDLRSNDYRFNQFVLNVDRTLSEGNSFDVGGRLNLMYGSDAQFIHQRGLEDNNNNDVQFDPTEFYLQLRAPVGRGLTFKFGKYVTTHGAEVISAPTNPLFSHSFLFNFAIPFTHTGMQLDYPLTDNLGLYYGLVKGWDVWDDNNDALTHMTGMSFTSNDKCWLVYVNGITGPERLDDESDERTVIDLTATHKWCDSFSTTLNYDYGWEDGLEGADDYWTGIAGYATYTFCEQYAATLRAEYFRDATGSRIGFTGDVTELTVGLDARPLRSFMNLRLRPELRWDHAAGDRPFDRGTEEDQVTFAIDAIVRF